MMLSVRRVGEQFMGTVDAPVDAEGYVGRGWCSGSLGGGDPQCPLDAAIAGIRQGLFSLGLKRLNAKASSKRNRKPKKSSRAKARS